MLWDGVKETVGPSVEFDCRRYEPAAISGSILRELMLPTRCCPHGTTRDLLAELRELAAKFVGLDHKSASLIARVVLSSAIVEAVSLAPALLIVGPDTARADRLVALLRGLCRHSVSLTGVTPAGFRSLASGARFTFLISQGTLSDSLQNLLDDASSQTGSVIESTAFVWGHGTGFQIHLVITSNKSTFAVSRLELELPWKEDQLMWLEDPEEIGGASRCYRFCGDRSLEFERNQVINHRLRVTRPFSSGESVGGYLLGLGSEPIPEAFPHGKMIPAFVILHDQFGRVCRAGVELWADRHPHAPIRRGLEVRREGGLLDKRDVIV